MTDIRERAKEILSAVPPLGQQVNSDGPTAALFTKLTGGVTHATLVKNWEKGGIMTTCNEFVGWYAAQLGSKKYLGRFDLVTYLPTIGKENAWVKSTEDARPKYGDICRHTAFHVGVSLDFDGDVWNHVDSGQGGPKAGHDVIKRTRGTNPYDFKKIQGWVDLDLYFASAEQTLPVPNWLLGWWKVTWRGQFYYYYYNRDYQVKWTRFMPRDTSLPPLLAVEDTGNFAIGFPIAVTNRWATTGSVEEFSGPQAKDQQPTTLQGTWNGTEPLTAMKM
jgi:hypothetical protein